MESFNFGAFDTNLGARIAAIPQEARKQQTANMLQAMQMQGAMRQNEMSQMQLDEMKTDRAEMVKLQQDLAAKGGSPDLRQYAGMLMRSPKHMQLGIQLIQKLDQQAQFADAMRDEPPARTAPAAAPIAPPEPGSFSADVAARTAAMPAFARSTNALAPLVAAPEALAALQQKRNRLRGIDSDQARAALRSVDAEIALASREPSYQNVPGVGLVDPRTGRVVTPSVESTDPIIKQYNLAVSQGFKGSILDYKREIARAGRAPAAPRAEAAPRTQQVTMRDGTLGIMNMDTGAITSATINGAPVKGKLSAFAEKTVEQQKQLGKNLAFGITQLLDITKDGGLIDQSTGSGAGRLVDLAAGFGGKAMPGAIAAGKIAPIADLALKLIPRFEGPQSNADTKSYKEASGQLADSSLPREIRKEAGKVVLRLMQERKNEFVTSDMATEGAPSSAQPAGGISVTAPNGQAYTFDTQEKADAFKKSAGIQ
jgi:hypothetical protein